MNLTDEEIRDALLWLKAVAVVHRLPERAETTRASAIALLDRLPRALEELGDLATTKQRLAEVERERFEAEQIAESRFAWAHQAEERTAEAIAAFVEKNGPHGVLQTVADIRAGSWRAKDGSR